MSDDNSQRLFNFVVFKLPLTNRELWGDDGGPPAGLLLVAVVIVALILVCFVYMGGSK